MIIIHTHLPNLDTVKTELVRYHDSGLYNRQIFDVDGQANRYLTQRISENNASSHPKKLAIVLDIDETSLSNYPNMLSMNFGGSSQDVTNAILKGRDPAIQPTLELFKTAEKNHVAVFFVTGRSSNLRPATVKNLDAAGYFAYDGLYMKPDRYNHTSVTPYKSSVRKQIEAKGYDIVLNVGDQDSDLAGGFADEAVKIPNPFYYIA